MHKTYVSDKCVVTVNTAKLFKMAAEIQKKGQDILDKVAFDIEASEKSLAAVDTGAMKSSVYVSGAQGGGSSYSARVSEAGGKAGKDIDFAPEVKPSSKWERIIGPSVIYAIYVELGGQPFVAPAVEAHRANFIKAWDQLLK